MTLLKILADGGLETVEDLYECIASAGGGWYRSFPGLSATDAVALADWLSLHASDIGEVTGFFYPEGSPAVTDEKPAGTEVSAKPDEEGLHSSTLACVAASCGPLPSLSGEFGTNRGGRANAIGAVDDKAAIDGWLRARAANPNTLSAYRREAERFLLWCIHERGIALSSASAEDVSLYLRWLEELGRTDPDDWHRRWRIAQEKWIGPRNEERLSPGWRPFGGPLSVSSRRSAVTAVKLLFNFLTRTGYLRFNPFDQVSCKIRFLPGEGAPKQFADRSLTEDQWAAVLSCLEAMPEGAARSRLRLVLVLGKVLGMRASEMIEARAGWIKTRMIGGEEMLVIEIVGKGEKIRRLPFPDEGLAAADEYFSWRGLPPVTRADPSEPLLVSMSRNSAGGPISRSGLYTVLTGLFERAAAEAELDSPADAAKLRAGSTHWLRHTFAVSALKTMDVNLVQTALGHASISTTTLYLTPEEARLSRAFKKSAKL